MFFNVFISRYSSRDIWIFQHFVKCKYFWHIGLIFFLRLDISRWLRSTLCFSISSNPVNRPEAFEFSSILSNEKCDCLPKSSPWYLFIAFFNLFIIPDFDGGSYSFYNWRILVLHQKNWKNELFLFSNHVYKTQLTFCYFLQIHYYLQKISNKRTFVYYVKFKPFERKTFYSSRFVTSEVDTILIESTSCVTWKKIQIIKVHS